MIKLDEKIVAIMYLQTLRTQDWMCGIRELEPGKFEVTYRFRNYDGDQSKDVFNDGDTKHWYGGTITGETREGVIQKLRSVAEQMEQVAVGKLYVVENTGGVEDFIEKFKTMPFAHMKTVTEEEYEREYGPVPAKAQV